jgi:RNA 3'-terminal phosphate cyclase (ATP)
LLFAPGEIRSGRYKFEIGTAGSTSLVLQTIFVPLSLAGSASTVIITGGTHVPHAPSYHYLERQWLWWMRAIGFEAQVSLDQAGFYPQGGGRISATIRPAGDLLPIAANARGELQGIQGISAVANLDASIAERQKRQALQRLEKHRLAAKIKVDRLSAASKGTLLFLLAEFGAGRTTGAPEPAESSGGCSRCCYDALGELGKPAEQVADEAVDELLAFLETEAAFDQFLADQLLLPLAFASGPSVFLTPKITRHLTTNAAIIQRFTPAAIDIQGEPGGPGMVTLRPGG